MQNNAVITSLEKLGFLDELREVFYQNTGLTISFLNPNGREYDFYPGFERNLYCSLLQSTPSGLKKCIQSDSNALEKAKAEKTFCIYKCHAGLTNAAIHLEYKGLEVGSIFTGQVLTESPDELQFEEIFKGLEQLDIPYASLKDAFLRTKVIPEFKLTTGVHLLNFMSNYIISVEDEFNLQNEKMELENELQKLKISILEYDHKQKQSRVGSPVVQDKNSHSILNAQIFIENNFHKRIKLNDVAASVYLSPNYFSTLFKEISGESFSLFLQKTRLNAAKVMLIETNLSIKEIVFAVGYDDYNYFNRIFRKSEGLPPAKFRDQNGD